MTTDSTQEEFRISSTDLEHLIHHIVREELGFTSQLFSTLDAPQDDKRDSENFKSTGTIEDTVVEPKSDSKRVFPKRHPLSRAKFFLDKAIPLNAPDRDSFEAYLEAIIIFGYAAIQKAISLHEDHSKESNWLNSLEKNLAIAFFLTHGESLLHEGRLKVGQNIFLHGEPFPVTDIYWAREFYYFDEPATVATETIRQHLDELVNILLSDEIYLASLGVG